MKILQHNEITKVSQLVTDIESQVKPFIKEMAETCRTPRNGRIGVAIAHCQVEKDNPLTFYVFANGDTIVNPEIISVKEKTWTMHTEGCLSFHNSPDVSVPRYRIIKAKYTLVNNAGIRVVEKNISDMTAYVMQHEMDHFKLIYIYDKCKNKE